MPCNYKDYPPNWKTEIRPAILQRDGNKCKFCGVGNHDVGYRDATGDWHKLEPTMEGETEGLDAQAWGFKVIWIILTIAHLDHDLKNNDYSNLAALCQLCHNRYDRKHRNGNSAETRRKKKGLQSLF
jgi:hypothetical protein